MEWNHGLEFGLNDINLLKGVFNYDICFKGQSL